MDRLSRKRTQEGEAGGIPALFCILLQFEVSTGTFYQLKDMTRSTCECKTTTLGKGIDLAIVKVQ